MKHEIVTTVSQAIAFRIYVDIHGRQGLGDEIDLIDAATRMDILNDWEAIIREEMQGLPAGHEAPGGVSGS